MNTDPTPTDPTPPAPAPAKPEEDPNLARTEAIDPALLAKARAEAAARAQATKEAPPEPFDPEETTPFPPQLPRGGPTPIGGETPARRPVMLTPHPDQEAAAKAAGRSTKPAPPPPAPEPPAEPRKPPEWKVLEPEDRSDPADHAVSSLQTRNDSWAILGASVRGKLHAHQGTWRDDAYGAGWVDDWTILAVSDGAGSARISRVGARIACDEAIKVLKELLSGHRLASGNGEAPLQADLMRLRMFLAEAARRAQRGILREAQKRACPAKDLNATFLLVVHCPWQDRDLVASLQVGDGAVGVFLADDSCKVLGVADQGEYSAETRFLTTPGIEHEFDQRVLFSHQKGVRCIAVLCDGVSDDFFPEATRLIELFIGNPIRDLKTKAGEAVYGVLKSVIEKPDSARVLLEWLRYEKRGSSDDRTLVLMYRSDQP